MSYNIIIVGNGGCLLQKENGEKIDSFDYVIRMGKAPLIGYEKHVGTKTDMLRIHWNRIISVIQSPTKQLLYEKKKDRYVYSGHDCLFKDLLLLENDPDSYYENSSLGSYNHLRKIFRRIPAWPTAIRDKPYIHIPERILHDAILYFFKSRKNIHNIYYLDSRLRIQLFQEFNKHNNNKKIIVPSGGIMTIFYALNTFVNANIYVTGFDNFKTPFYWETSYIKNTIHCSAIEKWYYKKLLKEGAIHEL